MSTQFTKISVFVLFAAVISIALFYGANTSFAALLTNPTISITSPLDGSTVTTGSPSTITGTSSYTDSVIRRVEVKTDTTDFRTATPRASGDWSTWSISQSFTVSGSNSITARVTDNAGNQQTATISVTVSDTTDPTVNLTSPVSSSTVTTSSAITISGTSSDAGTGIRTVEIKTDTTDYATATPRASGDWSTWSISQTFATSGYDTITARATDNAGNQQTDTVRVNEIGRAHV